MANGDLSGSGFTTVNLPEPPRSEWTRELVPKGGRLEMANGDVVFDSIYASRSKWKWSLSWRLMSPATYAAIQVIWYTITGDASFTDWEGVTAPVQPLLSTLSAKPITLADGSTRRYDVTMTLEGI